MRARIVLAVAALWLGLSPPAFSQVMGNGPATSSIAGLATLGAGLEIAAPLPSGGDDTAAIQALLDANPKAQISFLNYSAHWHITNLLLDDTTGRHFTGSLIGRGGAIDCITPGNATDTDIAMQRCIAGYATSTSGAGGDLNGFNGTIRDLLINAPTNGAGIYLTNGQNPRIEHNTITGGRYSLVLESSQNAGIRKNIFTGFTNAGVGLLMLSDTARVWYASATPLSSFFNDGTTIAENGFSSTVTGALAHILDHGSTAEGVRNIVGNFFFSGGGTAGPQFGYLGRGTEPNITGANWFENVAYPIRTLNTNASEGGSGTTLPGVTGSQPSGTYALSRIPDGYGYSGVVQGNFFAKGVNDINVSGQYGPVTVGGNFSQGVTGYHLVAVQGSPHVMDLGDTVTYNGGAYKQIAYAGYTDLTAAIPTATLTVPGISTLVPNATSTVQGIQLYSDPYANAGLFGTGADGTVTVTSTVTLTRPMHYANLTISGAGKLITNGYDVYVNNTLDISAAQAAAIVGETAINGGNGSGATAGVGGGATYGLRPVPVTTGATGNGGNGSTGIGSAGSGGAGNTGTVSGGTNAPGSGGAGTSAGGAGGGNTIAVIGQIPIPTPTTNLVYNNGTSAPLVSDSKSGAGGGGGGDGTNAGGGGGGGAQAQTAIVVHARNIQRGSNSTSSIINAVGGNGGNGASSTAGNTGGGGGGSGAGGTLVYIVVENLLGSTITNAINVSGGPGGAGGNGFGTGKGGNGGSGGNAGQYQIVNLSAPSFTLSSYNTTGTTGSTTTTVTGAAGGAGAVLLGNL